MNAEEQKKNIELRHETIQELLGNPPGWLTRYGITIFFIIIILLIIGSYFFKYPQVVKSSVIVTTERPPVWIVAQSSGKLDSIYVKNHATVKKGQLLATIHNTANIEDMQKLKEYLDSMQLFIAFFDRQFLRAISQEVQLGELQSDYAQLLKLLNEYMVFKDENIYQTRVSSMRQELEQQRKYIRQTNAQINLYRQSYSINRKQYERDSMLFSRQAANVMEVEQSQMQVLNGRIQLEQAKQSVINSNIAIIKLEQTINEYAAEVKMQEEDYRTNIKVAYENLKSCLWKWEQTYLLKTPSDGIVSFSAYWGKDQTIAAGEKSFAIVPHNPGKIIGKCKVSITGAGKIKKGQRVIIKLDEYPYMEYGMLEGVVRNLYLISDEEQKVTGKERFGMVDVYFPHKLTTVYRKDIPFSGELIGSAEIVTEEISLLEHLLSPIKYLINQ